MAFCYVYPCQRFSGNKHVKCNLNVPNDLPCSDFEMENYSIKTNNTAISLITGIHSEESEMAESVLFILLGLFIIFGNALSILVFWRRRFFLKRSTILLINLTTADLMVGLAVIGSILGNFLPQENNSNVEDIFMKIVLPFDSFAGLSSIFFLAAISLERAHAVLRPLRHVVMTTRCYVILVYAVWLLTVFLSGLILLSWCEYLNNKLTDIVISSFVGLALLLTCVSYTTIWIRFSRRVFIPRNTETMVNKKLVKTLFIVTAVSLISWLPFHIIFILLHLFPRIPISYNTILLTRLLQYANSLVNPIVYNLRMLEFRKAMLRLICGCVVKDRPKVEIRLMSMKKW